MKICRTSNIRAIVIPVALSLLSLEGCVSSSVPFASGSPPKNIDPATRGPVSGVGIEGQDIVGMTDQMMRDIMATPEIAGRATAPRVAIDSERFKNKSSQAIDRDLITNRLRIGLNRAAAGRMTFVTTASVDMAQEERKRKDDGATDAGTRGRSAALAGADYRLQGSISALDSRSAGTGLVQRYNQISFELVDLESGVIAWSGIYEFSKFAADDVSYR